MVGRSKRGGAGFGSRSRATSLLIQPACCALNVVQSLSLLQPSVSILGMGLKYDISCRSWPSRLLEEQR
jgi:hypothetical protein